MGELAVICRGNGPASIVQETGFENLHAVPTGRLIGDEATCIESNRMDTFLEWARSFYGLVIVDTAPLCLVADTLLLASKVDTTILVVRAGQTTSQDLDSACRCLRDVEAPLLGCIFNGLTQTSAVYYRYHPRRNEQHVPA